MLISLAFSVFHESVTDCPFSMDGWLAVKVAVGAAGGGGGGVLATTFFLAQAPRNSMPASREKVTANFNDDFIHPPRRSVSRDVRLLIGKESSTGRKTSNSEVQWPDSANATLVALCNPSCC